MLMKESSKKFHDFQRRQRLVAKHWYSKNTINCSLVFIEAAKSYIVFKEDRKRFQLFKEDGKLFYVIQRRQQKIQEIQRRQQTVPHYLKKAAKSSAIFKRGRKTL